MENQPVVVRPEEGTRYDFGEVSQIRVRVTGEASAGALTVFEVSGDVVRDVADTRQHFHTDFTEVFYIAEGEVAFVSGDGQAVTGLGPGSLIVVPPGVPHALAPSGPWRHVTYVLPGGLDRFFDDLAAAITEGGNVNREEISARYGTYHL